MKKKFVLLAMSALCAAWWGCTQNGNQAATEKKEKKKELIDTLKECYSAAYEKDSADLQLNIIDSSKVEGKLLINYHGKPKNDGTIDGRFKGDTLFVDYTFKTGKNSTIYSNPLAFLKKDGKLIMGVGQIETSLGKSYFVKDKPINFERGKFTFTIMECQEKGY
ncbi:hypothetical protein [Pedobacter sp. ASV28]|uniref:hypothetical protein n=1 Tax=Pedobacter sp. ASV28 TaxID=2795123 RepID=UPI0018ED907B|nr:hypothetical protein [Pedobacter sp. ASV28]